MRRFLQTAATAASVRPMLDAPDDVEIGERTGKGKRVLIVINHAYQARTLALPHPMQDVLGGTIARQSITLPPHGVAVLLTKGKTAP
jgi:beta-galactosidase